jgi:hypothetical protein
MDYFGLWKDTRYLEKKVAVGGETAVWHKREVMPLCVLKEIRDLYPNPSGIPYLGHTCH